MIHPFLSTLSLRRATLLSSYIIVYVKISIHALLAESDETLVILPKQLDDFYPRSPCGERRSNRPATMRTWKFLSTLSLRRATRAEIRASSQQEFLSTLSLRRATAIATTATFNMPISIHALLAESDYNIIVGKEKPIHFYPRSPCGERPNQSGHCER